MASLQVTTVSVSILSLLLALASAESGQEYGWFPSAESGQEYGWFPSAESGQEYGWFPSAESGQEYGWFPFGSSKPKADPTWTPVPGGTPAGSLDKAPIWPSVQPPSWTPTDHPTVTAPPSGSCSFAASAAVAAYNQRFGKRESMASLLGCNSSLSFFKLDIELTSGISCLGMIVTYKPGGDPAYKVTSLGSCR